MNPLVALKEKLMIKPNIEERERVAVLIKGIKKPEKNTPKKIKPKKLEEGEIGEGEIGEIGEIGEGEMEEGENKEREEEKEKINYFQPIIVDETQKGFDRDALFKKLTESKKMKVTVRPTIQVLEEKKYIEPTIALSPETKKAKKMEINKPIILEDEEEEEEEFVMKPKKQVKFIVEEEGEEKEEEIKEKEQEVIPVVIPKKKQRITEKPEKGIAILGPETLVQIGDTDLTKRMPKKLPPILIKVSSYYMNDREIFVNFINSLFEPYRKEISENKEGISCDNIGKTTTNFSLLTHQKIVRDYMNLYTPYRGLLLYHGLGSGKCHGKDTPILMYDGTIKLVQDIKVGDLLMGDDSKPRTVLSLARGKDKMYDIVPTCGEKYTVNQEHILCLREKGNKVNIKEISVKDYLQLDEKEKSLLKGYKVPIDFREINFTMDSYLFGISLKNNNSLQKILHKYKCNSRGNRLMLLAGIIDETGTYDSKKHQYEINYYEETVANDIVFMARSLGFCSYIRKNNNVNSSDFPIFIKGNLSKIPTIHFTLPKILEKEEEDVLVTDITVKYVNEDDYYGFMLDGNCRYVMGDFTVTHNTATSIAIAEGMKDSKRVIIMTPASLRANYIEELKKAGDLLYKRNQYWEWISTVDNPEALKTISVLLNLPQEYIRKHNGAFFINVKKRSNYDELTDTDKKVLEEQLNEMIKQKYTFINYNGLRSQRLSEMTSGYKKNIFDNAVVIIDEAHNLISRIVNKLKKEKPISGEENKKRKEGQEQGEGEGEKEKENLFGEQTPLNLATKLYYMLLRAKNSKIVLLTGTPIINYPNEFAILFNILRGYIKTWKIPLIVKTSNKIDKQYLHNILLGEKSLDYIEYSPSSKTLTITRNPFGFKNKIKKDSGYQGVSNIKKDERGNSELDNEFISDDDFERKIINILKRNDIDIIPSGIQVTNYKSLPDDLDSFLARYINDVDKSLKNVDSLKRRIIGLSSYFKSAQESLLPRYNKQLGVDYHIVRIPMSDTQFKIYETARHEERKSEKPKKKASTSDLFEDSTSTYRIFSRLFCNYVMPERPTPKDIKLEKIAKGWQAPVLYKDGKIVEGVEGEKEGEGEKNEEKEEDEGIVKLLREARKMEKAQDVNDDKEGEIEGDEVLDKLGGVEYKEKLDQAIKNLADHANEFLTPEALQTYSPKFLHILENIQDPEHQGLNLVYSQFRTAEGIGIFSLVLERNGFTRFKIKKNSLGIWEIDILEFNKGKPTYALYTGTETSEEKEIIRHIYNGEWDEIPESIGNVLKSTYRNNNMGEVIKVFMITSSGSEGINLRNTRYVHIMEPYWHPVRLEQVIGRARRICSHKDLPLPLQTVEVFVYLMIFSEAQLKSDSAIELKRKDLSKAIPHVPITSDQYLFEISEIKANVTTQLTDAIKESAFDCYIYSNGKCVNFGDPSNDKFSYVPDYAQQQNDTTVRANKKAIEWTGKPIDINGVQYIYRRVSNNVLDLYDKKIYINAMNDPTIIPLKIGTYEINNNGERVLKLLIT
jgi:hypothetical protein